MARFGNVAPDKMIFRALDTVGDGSGTTNAVGDYSSAADDFKITAQAGERLKIERMLVSYEDTTGMQAQEYGNIGAALTNGVEVLVTDGTGATILDLTNARPVKTNAEWGTHCFDADLKTWGAGNELMCVRWTFSKSGEPVFIDTGHSLVVRLNDSFTGLISHTFIVHGVKS